MTAAACIAADSAPARILALIEIARERHYGRSMFFLSQPRIAARTECSTKTVQRTMALFESCGALVKERGGGGRNAAGKGITNAWRIKSLSRARRLIRGHDRPNVQVGEIQEIKAFSCISKPKTLSRVARDRSRLTATSKATATATATSTATATPAQQESDFPRRQYVEPMSIDDPGLILFLALTMPHMAGTNTRFVRIAVFAAHRRGVDVQTMIDAWRAYVAFRLLRGEKLMAPDRFLDGEHYTRDWSLAAQPPPRTEAPRPGTWERDDNAVMRVAAQYGVTVTAYMSREQAVAAIRSAMTKESYRSERAVVVDEEGDGSWLFEDGGEPDPTPPPRKREPELRVRELPDGRLEYYRE